jgi:endonuclease I
VLEFNFQNGRDGKPIPKITFRLSPKTFFLTSPFEELDVTFVAVEPTGDDSQELSGFGFNRLVAVADEVLDGESVTIIQHPGGEPKQIALRENRVLKLPNTADRFLYYETDTTPGSSGAPVFNDQWEVVAIHHSGYPEQNAQGQYLTVDGQVWTEDMGEHRIHWIANEGIRVAGLLELLQKAPNLTAEQGRIRDEILSPPTPSPIPDERRDPRGDQAMREPVVDRTTGLATWTIPLQVSVSLGSVTFAAPQAPARDQPVDVISTKPTPPPVGTVAPVPTDDEVAEAKAELERSRTRVYYDKTADETDRTSYYKELPKDLTPAKLYTALQELLVKTHANKPAYKPMKHVYPWVDLQPDKKIKSVYSGQMFEPLELVRLDVEVARERQQRLEAFRASEAFEPGLEAARLDLLEAQLPFNCEHVVPQSWFNKKEPMRGDLHHLFACESGCNSFRGNTPYFDFSPLEEVVRQGCGRREEKKFEPTAGKGAVARATLYFLLRYPGEINKNANEYTPDRIKTLIAWHKKFAVGDYERHRNQAIFAAQGNRNPLIDFPEMADKIDFLKGLG